MGAGIQIEICERGFGSNYVSRLVKGSRLAVVGGAVSVLRPLIVAILFVLIATKYSIISH